MYGLGEMKNAAVILNSVHAILSWDLLPCICIIQCGEGNGIKLQYNGTLD